MHEHVHLPLDTHHMTASLLLLMIYPPSPSPYREVEFTYTSTVNFLLLSPQMGTITVYHLLTKKNKLPLSASIYSKQTEVYHLCFLLVLFFLVVKRQQQQIYTETRTIHIDIYSILLHYTHIQKTELYICCRFKQKIENRSPGNCP